MSGPATPSGVRVLGEGVPYLDGAEDSLLHIMRDAVDTSTESDELSSYIVDWPSQYHLSRLRRNLLFPLELSGEPRVLDVGCGTGALSRSLAESGARVTGLEGSISRAAVAAERTAGMPNCEIVCGSLSEYRNEGHAGEFDMVLLCGVLEYSISSFGGAGGPHAMLTEARELLKPDGVVVLAIENQLGLKYLLGYPEDHRGVPWIGIDGYRSGKQLAQTWSREELGDRLSAAGLLSQEWFYPYPDYKLPTAVVRHDVLATLPGRQLAKQFIRNPVRPEPGVMTTADAVSALHIMLDAGLGPDTANSFLVVAGGAATDPGRHLKPGLLWMSTGERKSDLMSRRVLLGSVDGEVTLEDVGGRAEVNLTPLRSRRVEVPVLRGSNLEDELVALASRAERPADLTDLLREWWSVALPWLPDPEGGYHFDVMPRNYIRTADGSLHYVDREWVWLDPAPTSWALFRALWLTIQQRLWPAGAMAGLSWDSTLGEATLVLAQMVDDSLRQADLESAIELEAQMQHRVGGGKLDDSRAAAANLLGTKLKDLVAGPVLAQALERTLIAQEESRRAVKQAERAVEQAELYALSVRDDVLGLQAELATARGQLAELEWQLAAIRNNPVFKAARKGKDAARRLRQ